MFAQALESTSWTGFEFRDSQGLLFFWEGLATPRCYNFLSLILPTNVSSVIWTLIEHSQLYWVKYYINA